MKTSAVLASLLFGSYAVAAPFDRRALVYKTEVVTETVVVYTTVYDDEYPEATSTAPAYEQQKPSTTSTAVVYPLSSAVPAPASSSSAPAYTPAVPKESSTTPAHTPVVPKESSTTPAYIPVVPESSAPAAETSTSIYTPEPVYTPKPSPTPSPEPQPETSSVAPPPAPTTTEAAYTPVVPTLQQAQAAPTPTSAAFDPAEPGYMGSGVSSGSYTDVDMTIYYNTGAAGACGVNLNDDMIIAAIAQPAWDAMGGSTYDTATGKSANPWCGTEIEVEHNGKTVKATIMDLCPACVGHDVDLSLGAWTKLGLHEPTRLKASWSVV